MDIRPNQPSLELFPDGFIIFRPGAKHVEIRWSDIRRVETVEESDTIRVTFKTMFQVWEITNDMQGFDVVMAALNEYFSG